jgi:hypothetical protein
MSEWFRRFKEMLDLALSQDGCSSEVGSMMLALHDKSTLATAEAKQLVTTVLARIIKPVVEEAAKPSGEVRFVVEGA